MASQDICQHWNWDNVADSLHGRLIYKDECCRCFASPKSQGGLEVCLKCFVGSCNDSTAPESHNHSKIHFRNTEHPLVLKIEKIKVNSEPIVISKVAIGKSGGIDCDADRYETQVSVYCHSCNVTLDKSNPKVASMVDSVMLAQSAFEQNQVGEWEMEFKPCEHTLMLDQSGSQRIPDKSLAHCQECDLKSNLWLCMTCGHLGCGRQNYDGTGGNGHGLEHFQTTGHCVNVKIGTITPEGKAAIHCYKCDEEVVDPELAAHLGVLGIEITSQVKTEKNMAELNLEMNLNATLSKQLEDGKELIQVWGPMNTGIQNLGNSCYMNSVLQVLFSQEEFRNKYALNAEDHLVNCKKYTPECFQCQVQKLALGLVSGRYSQKTLADKYITEENG